MGALDISTRSVVNAHSDRYRAFKIPRAICFLFIESSTSFYFFFYISGHYSNTPAKYTEATETEGEDERDAVMGEIFKYNEEDLEATWAVFQWLRSKC